MWVSCKHFHVNVNMQSLYNIKEMQIMSVRCVRQRVTSRIGAKRQSEGTRLDTCLPRV
jgi:hypothetical protein